MRVAFAFRRPDVDGFMDEITREQFIEWSAFFELNPTDWQATSLAVGRSTWATFQAVNRKKIDPRKCVMRLTAEGPTTSDATFGLRMEALAIRGEITERMKTERTADVGEANQ